MNVPIKAICESCKKIAREYNKKRQRKYRLSKKAKTD